MPSATQRGQCQWALGHLECSRARLKFLVADWGIGRFRAVLESEYLGYALPDGPAPPPPAAGDRDHVGVHRQRDGRYYVGVAPHVGRTSGTQLSQVADLAETYGSGTVRTATEQKLLVLDIPERRLPQLIADLDAIDVQASPSPFRRGTMACTGIEFDPGFGRKLRGLKVSADGMADDVERLLRHYLAGRTGGEQFGAWVRRADESLLK